MSNTKIHPFPEMVALAEEEARDCHDRFARLTWGVSDGWSELDGDAQQTLVEVHVERLCDLTRPAARDAVARLVAKRIGLSVVGTAPALRLRDDESPAHWVLRGEWDERAFTYTRPRGWVPPAPDCWLLIPPLEGITDPAEALTLIVRHLWPQES